MAGRSVVRALLVLTAACSSQDSDAQNAGRTQPKTVTHAAAAGETALANNEHATVQAEMRRVDFHVDSSIILGIHYLRGGLVPLTSSGVPYFDDKRSFLFKIDTAEIRISMRSLNDLLNRYVFAYPGAPLHRLQVSIEGTQLKQKAVTHGITVTTVSDVSVTPEGDIRLHPTSIKAAGLPVGGGLRAFGLRLQKLVDLSGAKGVRFEGNDLLLSVRQLLPPPAINGHLVAVTLADSEMVQVFRPNDGRATSVLRAVDASTPNYMYYRGGVLRFGRLTMTDADLLIVDADPSNPFDFFLDHYNDQLVAGYSKNTMSKALISVWPDYRTAAATQRKGGLRPAVPHAK